MTSYPILLHVAASQRTYSYCSSGSIYPISPDCWIRMFGSSGGEWAARWSVACGSASAIRCLRGSEATSVWWTSSARSLPFSCLMKTALLRRISGILFRCRYSHYSFYSLILHHFFCSPISHRFFCSQILLRFFCCQTFWMLRRNLDQMPVVVVRFVDHDGQWFFERKEGSRISWLPRTSFPARGSPRHCRKKTRRAESSRSPRSRPWEWYRAVRRLSVRGKLPSWTSSRWSRFELLSVWSTFEGMNSIELLGHISESRRRRVAAKRGEPRWTRRWAKSIRLHHKSWHSDSQARKNRLNEATCPRSEIQTIQ